MGRSVNYLNRSLITLFFDVSLETDENGKIITLDENDNEVKTEPDQFDHQFNWDNFFDSVNYSLRKAFNFDYISGKKRWEGNEVQIILENRFIEIGMSEYCGLASVSIRVNETSEGGKYFNAIAEAYIESIEAELIKVLDENVPFTRLNKVGSFSNGEGVFEKAK